ncbi:MAG: gas vesicle protein K [Chloroflexota bacterium]
MMELVGQAPEVHINVEGGERAAFEFEAELSRLQPLPRRVNAQPDDAGTGLAKLVLSLIEFLRQLLERQAVRRMDAGDLSEEDVERMGLTLMQLEQKMSELTQQFGLSPQDLNLDLGPLGRLL